MHKNEILNIIKLGENIQVEFKESKDKLPKNLFETVCAFLNTKGGVILLGVDDNGQITGIDKDAIVNLKKDIANLANNKNKLAPSIILTIDEFEIKDRTIISIQVPESSQVHNTLNKIYIRNQDGDYKVSHPIEIAKIVNRKQNYHTEDQIFEQLSVSDFNQELIMRAKQLIKINNPNNHWWELDNEEFLIKAGFYKTSKNNISGFTLASVVFFGTDKTISTILPSYKFEALLRKENIDRYDDRLTIRTNILDAYDLYMSFIEKHLNNPFYLEGSTRINLRTTIFRELVANIITHREYLSPVPGIINIFSDKIEFTNPNNPIIFGKINPKNFMPIAKNPTISKLMLQMGRVEEVGSGMRNVFKYLPHYAKNSKVKFIDGEIFSTIIEFKDDTIIDTNKINLSGKTSGKTSGKILGLIKGNKYITIPEMARIIGITERSIERNIKKLHNSNMLKRVGPAKGGFWEIIN